MAQELLTTFEQELSEVALVPGSGGVFAIRVDGETVWSRAEAGGGSPDPTAIKRSVRDLVAPDKSLGHTDRAAT